jgi:hypothetical protein
MTGAESRQCLNGRWDFLPMPAATAHDAIPETGWLARAYLVPSPWNVNLQGTRAPGEDFFRRASADRRRPPAESWSEIHPEAELLFDAYGYPRTWSETRTAWIRRRLEMAEVLPGQRYFLVFEAVSPQARLLVNGREAGCHYDPALPFEADVTDLLHVGDNEIVVQVLDHEYDDRRRALVPCGNEYLYQTNGIWQDAWLVRRGEVHVEDVTIRTSVREGSLWLRFRVRNASGRDRRVVLRPEVRDWHKGVDAAACPVALPLPALEMIIPADNCEVREMAVPWLDAKRWESTQPNLYQVVAQVCEGQEVLSTGVERFGFREVWIEGPDVMLNGHPVHLFSDWGHKMAAGHHAEAWIRQWFGMIRDGNMNHSRLHTHPHPRIYLDLADEEGILITGEAGIHGSGGDQAADDPAYWHRAERHVREFVRRDKNHPCIVLWSVDNEMRWNGDKTTLTYEHLPRLRRLFNELDPTRPAYHEGDSTLWDEAGQDILSRHYGKECAGVGWWDQRKPLHSGEMSIYHYMGANNTLHLGGDRVWADYSATDEAAARDTALIVEAGRTRGACCFGPWNLSCLCNLRLHRERIELPSPPEGTPGIWPRQVLPYSSEFEFWRDGKGYHPHRSFAVQAHAFRPLAVIDPSLRTGYFSGTPFRRELWVVNDTPGPVSGRLQVAIGGFSAKEFPMTVGQGLRQSVSLDLPLPTVASPASMRYQVCFTAEDGRILDEWGRALRVAPPPTAASTSTPLRQARIAVHGSGCLCPWLKGLGLTATRLQSLDTAALAKADILVVEPFMLEPGSPHAGAMKEFVERGGRLVVLEQATSPFAALPLASQTLFHAFVRAPGHPLLADVDEADLFAWGDDGYADLGGDAWLARKPFRKNDSRHALFVVDSGEGGFGDGDLESALLVEARQGCGLILASQLRLVEKLATIPAAAQIILNLLNRAASWQAPGAATVHVLEGAEALPTPAVLAKVAQGEGAYVAGLSEAALAAWAKALEVRLEPWRDRKPRYQAVRAADGHPLLVGVNQADTSGIDTWTYGSKTVNHPVGEFFLRPTEALEPLLVTPTRSGLEELFVQGGLIEPLRAHTVSRWVYDRPDQEYGVVVGIVSHGQGRIVFDLFRPDLAVHPRFRRLRHRLLANLGQAEPADLLGETVPVDPNAASQGFPDSVYLLDSEVDADTDAWLRAATRPGGERLRSLAVMEVPGWRQVPTPAGELTAETVPSGGALTIHYAVVSPTVRKNLETNLGVPNPEALTFLELHGEGRAEVTINAVTRSSVDLATGVGTVSDISLEANYNYVLIRWFPARVGARLRTRWRNIMRRPETGLRFT